MGSCQVCESEKSHNLDISHHDIKRAHDPDARLVETTLASCDAAATRQLAVAGRGDSRSETRPPGEVTGTASSGLGDGARAPEPAAAEAAHATTHPPFVSTGAPMAGADVPEPRRRRRRRRRRPHTRLDEEDERRTTIPRTYNANFMRAVSKSPLIGDRHATEDITAATGRRVAKGLRAEARRLAQEGDESDLFVETYRHGWADIAGRLERATPEELPREAVWAYSVESFLYKVPNRTLRDQDESRMGFAPFIRVLHDTLENLWGGLEQFQGPVFRVMSMDDATAERYRPHVLDKRANIFSWDGFTSGACEAEVAYMNCEMFGANTLIIIRQEPGQGPVDIRRVSDFGEDEAEVMYPLGQRFEKVSVRMRRASEVWGELGVERGTRSDAVLRVIELMAVDQFYELAKDLFRDGGTAIEGIQILKERVMYEERVAGPESEKVAFAAFFLGDAQRRQRYFEDALQTCQKSITIYKKIHGEHHLAVGSLLALIGSIHAESSKMDEAEEYYQKDYKLRLELQGANHTDTAQSMNNLGEVLRTREKLEEAMEMHQNALRIRYNRYGDNHYDTAQSYDNISKVHRQQGRPEEALDYAKRALRVQTNILGKVHPSTADSYYNIGYLYMQDAQYQEALDNYRDALQIRSATLGDEHSKTKEAETAVVFCENRLKRR